MEKKKVMIVDDEEYVLKILKLNLEKTGKYEIMALSNGKHIVSQVNSFKPDIILLDLLMPSIGGLEVCEMLNNDPFGSRIPIIITSALSKDVDKHRAYEFGIVSYLTKPIEADVVIAEIEKFLKYKEE